MRNSLWKLATVAFIVLAIAAAGCSKKQTVKSDVDEGAITETELRTPADQDSTAAAQPETDPGVAVTEEKPSIFADVLFEFDQFDLTEAGRKTSQDVAAYIRKNPKAKFLIEGHCDARGTAEYNMALGDRRAMSVKNYILSLGVPEAALSTVSYGKERLLDMGASEDAHAKNRRAHFVLK